MRNPVINLHALLCEFMSIDQKSHKARLLYNLLCSQINEYSQFHSITLDALEYMKESESKDSLFKYQDRGLAFDLGQAAFKNGDIKIETCDPENYVDILSGKLPEWSFTEQRRIAKMWTLK